MKLSKYKGIFRTAMLQTVNMGQQCVHTELVVILSVAQEYIQFLCLQLQSYMYIYVQNGFRFCKQSYFQFVHLFYNIPLFIDLIALTNSGVSLQ